MEIKEGQVWKYDNRPGEEESRVIILKLDEENDGSVIVHVQVLGLDINNPNSDESIEEITHMPFTREAAESSLLELMGETELPSYEDGYDDWKQEHEAGNAGVFSITIGESVKYMDETLNG